MRIESRFLAPIHRISLVLAVCTAIILLAIADCNSAQDGFYTTFFRYRAEDDTINQAFALRLDKQIIEKTKLKLSYLHSDTRYWKVIPEWEPESRNYSHGDQYSLQVEQKTIKDGKLVVGYTFIDHAIRLTDAYLIHEMEKKAENDPEVGGLRRPCSSSYNISYSQPLFDQNTTIEVSYSYTDAHLTPYWEYNINTLEHIPNRFTSYTNAYTLSVTQIFTQTTMCQFSASYATQSDLPATWSYSAQLHQYVPPTRTSLQVYYRYSGDGDCFYTNTVEGEVFQYVIEDIILTGRYRVHFEDDPSLDEETEDRLWEQQEDGNDLSVTLFPGKSVTIGGGVILNVLGLAGRPAWMGADYLDKINLDIHYNRYRHNSKFDTDYYLDGDLYSAGLGFLF